MKELDPNKENRDSRLEQLFGELPTETETIVNLPSEGRFYANKTSQVNITPITFEDEKQLSTSVKNRINPVNLIISKCTKGIDTNNLLLMDKLYLLLKIREISYGSKYPAGIACPKCSAETEVTIDLSDLITNKLDIELTDPREVTLPKLKKPVKVRFPRVYDEQYLNSQEQIYNNIWRFVTELNGIKDPVFINKAIPKMHIMDIKFMINHIMRPDLGLDPRFMYECGFCGATSEMAVPISENFFSVT